MTNDLSVTRAKRSAGTRRYPRSSGRWSILLGAGVIAGAWIVASQHYPPYLLPGPRTVVGGALSMLVLPETWAAIGATFGRIGLGTLLSTIAGAVCGVIIARRSDVGGFLEPFVFLLQGIPSICWSLLAIVWLGVGNAAPIFVFFTVGFPIVVVGTIEATQGVSRDLMVMAKSLGLTRAAQFRKVLIPSILGPLLASVRLAFGYGWRVSILAEAIGYSGGIGHRLMASADRTRFDHVLQWTLIGLLTVLSVELLVFRRLDERLLQWRSEAT